MNTMKKNLDRIEGCMYWTAVSLQQNIYETSTDWNLYKEDEHIHLKKYISYVLYGPPEYTNQSDDIFHESYIYSKKGSKNSIDKIYNKIVKYGSRSNNNKEILCNVLYNVIFDEKLRSTSTNDLSKIMNVHSLFKVKCNVKDNDKPKIYYIDTKGRVYWNWDNFLKTNDLPSCRMYVPKDGIYQANLKELWSESESTVWIESYYKDSSKITKLMDTCSNCISVGCIAAQTASLLFPATAALSTATYVGLTASGLWGSSKAVANLVDLKTHDQSIGIKNKEAVPAWFQFIGNTFGVTAAGSSAFLSKAIQTGTTIGKGTQITYNMIVIGNMISSSSLIIYNSVDLIKKYNEKGEISVPEILSVITNVLFLYHSVINIKLAAEIIKTNQNKIIQDYEDSLRFKRHKREFRRLIRNTKLNISNNDNVNAEIIRGLTKINNKDEFFSLLSRNRKLLSTSGTKVSLRNGQVQMNNESISFPKFISILESNLNKKNSFKFWGSGNRIVSSNQSKQVNTPQKSSNVNNLQMVKAVFSNVCETFGALYPYIETKNFIPTQCYDKVIAKCFEIYDRQEFQDVLDAAVKILMNVDISKSLHEILCDIVYLILKLLIENFTSNYEIAHFFDQTCKPYINSLTKSICKDIEINFSEWINTFSASNVQDQTSETISRVDLSNYIIKHCEWQSNDIMLLNPEELYSSKNIFQIYSQAFASTKAKEAPRIKDEQKTLYLSELEEFFLIYSYNTGCDLKRFIENIPSILAACETFDKKYIIFYKLVYLSITIDQTLCNQTLTGMTFIQIINFLWTFINININIIEPHIDIFSERFEEVTKQIIIAIYHDINIDPKKWSNAFNIYSRVP